MSSSDQAALLASQPVCEVDPFAANVVLLILGDDYSGVAAFTDDSAYEHGVVDELTTGVVTTRNPLVFGRSSVLIGAFTKYLRVQPIGTEFDFGTGAVTWDGFIILTASTGVQQALVSKMSTTAGLQYEWLVGIAPTYAFFYYGIRSTNQSLIRLFWPTAIPLGTLVHFNIQRNGAGVWSCALNGVPGTTYQVSPLGAIINYGSVITGSYTNAVNIGTTTNPVWVGNNFSGQYLAGQFKALRMTVGVARRAGAFTPPALLPCPVNSSKRASRFMQGLRLTLSQGIPTAVSVSNNAPTLGLSGMRLTLNDTAYLFNAAKSALMGMRLRLFAGSVRLYGFQEPVRSYFTIALPRLSGGGTSEVCQILPTGELWNLTLGETLGSWGTPYQANLGDFFDIKLSVNGSVTVNCPTNTFISLNQSPIISVGGVGGRVRVTVRPGVQHPNYGLAGFDSFGDINVLFTNPNE
jgi:hypothetical protein